MNPKCNGSVLLGDRKGQTKTHINNIEREKKKKGKLEAENVGIHLPVEEPHGYPQERKEYMDQFLS